MSRKDDNKRYYGNVRVILWGLNAGLGDWGPDVYEVIAKSFMQRHRFPWSS